MIAAIYGFATMLLVWLYFNGTPLGRTFAMVLAPVCAIVSLGIAFRVNVFRVVLMILLVIAVVADGLLILFYAGALAGVFQSPPNKEPLEELTRMPFRLAATVTMLYYLKRADVRDAFRRPAERDGVEDRRIGSIDRDA